MDNVVDVEVLDWAHNLSWFDGISYIFLQKEQHKRLSKERVLLSI